jgi:hypothetical protein
MRWEKLKLLYFALVNFLQYKWGVFQINYSYIVKCNTKKLPIEIKDAKLLHLLK